MKVGIITYHRAKNLGAMLQSYALQQILEKYYGECEIIDYRNKKMEDLYRIKKTREINSLKEKIKNILYMRKNKKFEVIRKEFIENFQKISKETYDESNINLANKKYDLFVTGSDQVWNTKLNYKDKNYFLDFVCDNQKRNSYAASFGTNKLKDEDEKEIKAQLEKFNHISVREEEGKKIVQDLINRDCKVTLDPTLLLKKEQWEKIIDNERMIKEKYIFVYIVAYTPTLLEFAKKMAKERKCKLICFHNSYQRYSGMRNLTKVSPQDFLNYIKYAECVITSSFHGLCFSINLQKDFYYELDEGKENNNSRLITLSKNLNLENRRIIKGECKDKSVINYEKVIIELDRQRDKAIEFIKDLKTKGDGK